MAAGRGTLVSDLSVHSRREATPELIEFIESVAFGGTGLRYQRIDLERALDPLGSATYLSLEREGAVRGSYVLAEAGAELDDMPVRAVYRGLLAVDPGLRRSGHGRRLVETALGALGGEPEPIITWGLIERENEASRRLLQSLGATEVGSVMTRLVYRQWPKASPDLVRLDGKLEQEYAGLRSSPGGGLTLAAPARLPAYGLVRDGELIAAARVSRSAIDLGAGGPLARFLHRYGYSRFRAIGKRYNRRAFGWLGIHDPLVVQGQANAWREFLPALLAEHDMHMALFTLDPASDAAAMLEEAGLFGRFADATRQELKFVASGINLAPGWDEKIRATPIRGGPVL